MATALIPFDPEQGQRLARRAEKCGKSFPQEAKSAADGYLSVPRGTEAELSATAKAASQAAGRMFK